MALIDSFHKLPATDNRVHGTVSCGYKVFGAGAGTIIQLDTYGSPQRQIEGKVSQSIQLDEKAALQLMSILRLAFPEA